MPERWQPTQVTDNTDIQADFAALLGGVGLDPADTGGQITFTGQDPILPSNHRLGAIMAMGMMGPAAATQIFYRMRGGPAQDLSVDLRRAAVHINPLAMFTPTVGGFPYQVYFADPKVNPLGFNMFPTKDGRWYLPTAAYPNAVPQWMSLLKADLNKDAMAAAIAQWNALDLENAAAERGMIGAMVRTPQEWYTHPQGQILAQTPMIEIIKIGDSDPELPPLVDPSRPLSGIKVAAFTHVIAGPNTGRTLAEQGAEVLHMARPEYEYDALLQDTHLGFRSTWMDLAQDAYKAKAQEVLKGADVVVENFRGRKIANLGLSAEQVAALRPGMIYTSLRAFGWEGPWQDRGGFDMDANCTSGYAVLEGSEDHPLLPPTVILNDYLAGYLTAMGIVAALILRAKNGGSYHVRCSLTRFSMWYSQLGVFDPAYVKEMIEKPDHKPILTGGISFTGAYGKQVHLEPGITFSKTPGHWNVPGHPVVSPRGASGPEWLGY
ncbi:CoA transferase [Mycolicibacterium sp.]|uniref:CoA transferase n=1 Tax=Mycolicibacterium sp. TaxID=2320850 RepID=UPI0028AC0794|nr:CoA transferase [Mycolicibacterium sp.]